MFVIINIKGDDSIIDNRGRLPPLPIMQCCIYTLEKFFEGKIYKVFKVVIIQKCVTQVLISNIDF